MRKAADDRPAAPSADAAIEQASSGTGAPLPDGLRDRFEASLGTDLSTVRIHTGEASASAADAVSARAYALGQDVHFAAGEYRPGTSDGDFLIAHEVAHTVQQRGGGTGPQFKLAVSEPGDAAERAADAAAACMVSGQPAALEAAAPAVMREPNQSVKPAVSSEQDHLAQVQIEAKSIADQLGKSAAAASLKTARDGLAQCKAISEATADVYDAAQTEVIKEEIKKQEAKIAEQQKIHDLVKGGVSKVVGLIVPGSDSAKEIGMKVGGLAGAALAFLIEKGGDKMKDVVSEAATNKMLGPVEDMSKTPLPKNTVLREQASAKQLWQVSSEIGDVYDKLLSVHKKATVLSTDIVLQASHLDTHSKVPVKSAQGTTMYVDPKAVDEIDAMVQRLRDAQATVAQAAGAAEALSAQVATIRGDLAAVQVLTTKDYAKLQIRASSGIGGYEESTSSGKQDVTEVMTVWNRMVGETVTATTDCKPDGQCKPAYYPPKAIEGAPDKPTVYCQVGDGLGELVTGQQARIIAIVSAGFYGVKVLVRPLATPAAPAYNGEVCEENMSKG